MYYPLLRGRQNELLALQELLNNSALGDKVIPVVEPVKLSPTLVNTVEMFQKAERDFVLIRNPMVGSFNSDAKNPKNNRYVDRLKSILQNDSRIHRGIIVDRTIKRRIEYYRQHGICADSIVAICTSPEFVKDYQLAFEDLDVRTLVPYAPAFRRIRNSKILLDDKFHKKERNAEYSDPDDEFFSDDHLFYADEYVGFSDYSVIGEEYSEAGFAPYAVAIHIVYEDVDKSLRVHHFVSDTNDDISDPAGKFYEALKKLHEWNRQMKLDTLGIQQLEEIYAQQSYPGLGVVKRLSIMHHIELVGKLLSEV